MAGTVSSSQATEGRTESPGSGPRRPRSSGIARWCGAAAAAIGGIALVGWALQIIWMKSIVPGEVAMKANAAVGVVLLGAALLLATGARTWVKRTAFAASVLAATIGLLTLAETIFHRDFGIDQLLFHEAANAVGTAVPGRMATTAALCLILMGCALAALVAQRITIAQGLAAAGGFVVFFELLAFVYGARGSTPEVPFTLMAPNTIFALLLLSTGTLLARLDGGFMTIATEDATGGRMLRRVAPPTLLALVVGMRVVELAADSGLFDHNVGVAVSTTVSVVLLTVIAWFMANALNRDEAKQRAAENAVRESEERFRTLVDHIPGVSTIEVQDAYAPYGFRVEFISPQVFDMFGSTIEEWIADPNLWMQVIHPDDRPQVAAANAESLASGHPFEVEYRALSRTGEVRWIHEESFRTGPPGDLRWHGLMTDISDRKLVETATREKEVAERANRAKSDFLSRVSHEFRTPLNAVLGFAQLLEMDDLSAEQRDNVGHIGRGGRHLLDLINEVLDITRIEAGRVSMWMEPTPLTGVVRESVELLRPLAEGRRIVIEIDPEADWGGLVMADEQRLKQVLLNLLSNAIKYNREGGTVTVSCRKAVEDRLCIDVADTGPGIAEDQIEKAFAPFERLGADQRQVEGTGLGLTLSQNLVEAMGGTLTATSSVGVGSTFSVELLLAGPSIAVPEPKPDEPSAGVPVPDRHRTILYIEDNLSNVLLVERILERVVGTRLLTAMQGGLGLELAREHRPDLILLDLHLPDIEGAEVLRKLREDPRTRDIRTVILTADADPAQARVLTDSGADAVLTKPIDVDELLRIVE